MKKKREWLKILPELPEKVKKKGYPCYFQKKEIGNEFVRIHQGPTRECNWIIQNRVLMSAYPFNKNHSSGKKLVKVLLNEAKIDVFVTLQTKKELQRFEDYFPYVKEMKSSCQRIFLEMIDQNPPDSVDETKKVVDEVIEYLDKGKNILLHCWGGMGRTALFTSCLLNELYPEMKLSQIFKRVQVCANTRVREKKSIIPHSLGQRKHVAEYIKKFSSLGKKLIDIEECK